MAIPYRSRIIVVAGPPCGGKSRAAAWLATELDAPHLEMDQFRRRALPRSDNRVEDRDIAYRAMHCAAEAMLPWCGTVILDATYAARRCRTDLCSTVDRAGAALFVIECHVAPLVAVERFAARGPHPAVDLTPERVARLARQYPYFADACTVTDADDPVQRRLVLRSLHGHPAGRDARAIWCRQGRPRASAGSGRRFSPSLAARTL